MCKRLHESLSWVKIKSTLSNVRCRLPENVPKSVVNDTNKKVANGFRYIPFLSCYLCYSYWAVNARAIPPTISSFISLCASHRQTKCMRLHTSTCQQNLFQSVYDVCARNQTANAVPENVTFPVRFLIVCFVIRSSSSLNFAVSFFPHTHGE